MAKVPPQVLGEGHLRRVVAEYVEHYYLQRTHQGLGNTLIDDCVASGGCDRPCMVALTVNSCEPSPHTCIFCPTCSGRSKLMLYFSWAYAGPATQASTTDAAAS